MATVPAITPALIIRDVFIAIPEIEQVYISQQSPRTISTLIVIDGKDYGVLDRIFEHEAEILKAIPDVSVNFDVVIRDGRPLTDVARPIGKPLFQR